MLQARAFAFSNSINALTIDGGTTARVIVESCTPVLSDDLSLACSDNASNHASFRSAGDTKRTGTQRAGRARRSVIVSPRRQYSDVVSTLFLSSPDFCFFFPPTLTIDLCDRGPR
jgi:hypothetical protein